MTFPAQRLPRVGCNPPRTREEFVTAWEKSSYYHSLQVDIEQYKTQNPIGGPKAESFRQLKRAHQSNGQRVNSPYTLTYAQQVKICMWRGLARFKADPWPAIWVMVGNTMMALIM